MGRKYFDYVVASQIKDLSKKRDLAFNNGEFSVFQNCCNQLRGISFVVSHLKDYSFRRVKS